MATETPSPDGLTAVESPSSTGDQFDTPLVDRPEMGELVQGILLAKKEDRGEYDSTILDLRLTVQYRDFDEDDNISMWSTAGIDNLLEAEDVRPGDEFAISVESTTEIDGQDRREYEVFA